MTPPHFDDWPSWAQNAQRAMEACGVPPEVILTKALLLGFEYEPWNRKDGDVRFKYVEYIWYKPSSPWARGLLGITVEMLAYRFLTQHYPSVLKNTS